jgi:hypothetical protein
MVSKTSSFEEYLRPVAASVPPELISPSVKIVYQPGGGLEAKAYLAVKHHWHTPALQG